MATEAIEREQIPLGVLVRQKTFNWERAAQIFVFLAILGIWEYFGRRLGDFFLAPPSALVSATQEMLSTGELLGALRDSVSSLLVGFGLAIVIGIVVGFLMGWYQPLGRSLDPFVSALYVVPIAALVPVLIIWFGLGFTSRTLTILLFSVFEILIATYAGVRYAEANLVDAARSFGASRYQLFTKVVAFAALPHIFTGLRIGAGRALKGMVVAELLFAVTGMGGAISTAANYYRTDKVFVYVIVLSIVGVALAGAVKLLERIAMPWKQERAA